MVLMKVSDVAVGDKFMGRWRVTAVSETDHYGEPAIQLTLGKLGRVVFTLDQDVPIEE